MVLWLNDPVQRTIFWGDLEKKKTRNRENTLIKVCQLKRQKKKSNNNNNTHISHPIAQITVLRYQPNFVPDRYISRHHVVQQGVVVKFPVKEIVKSRKWQEMRKVEETQECLNFKHILAQYEKKVYV